MLFHLVGGLHDFVSENLSDWNKQSYLSPQEYLHDATGLSFDGYVMTAPYGFSGDFTLTLIFNLDTGKDDTIVNLEVGLIDGFFNPGQLNEEEYIMAEFGGIGDVGTDFWNLYDNGSDLDYSSIIEGIRVSGENKFILKRTGNNLKTWMNDTVLSNINYENCSLTSFVPYIYLNTADLKQIRLKSISVKYSGEKKPR